MMEGSEGYQLLIALGLDKEFVDRRLIEDGKFNELGVLVLVFVYCAIARKAFEGFTKYAKERIEEEKRRAESGDAD